MSSRSFFFGVVVGCGTLLGRVMQVVTRRTGQRMAQEISSIFPEMRSDEIDLYLRKFYKFYVLNKIDVFFYPFMKSSTIEGYAELTGAEHIDNALAGGKGVLLVHPHFGNPQMLMPGIGHRGYDLCQVGQAPEDVYEGVRRITGNRPNIPAYTWLKVKSFFEKYLPVEFIHIGRVSLKTIYSVLKENRLVAMTVDGISHGDGEWEFLGRKTELFSTGPIRVAYRSGSALLPLFVSRGEDGRHLVIVEPELKFPVGVSKEEAITQVMREFVSRLESHVKEEPWLYGRFLGYHDAHFFDDDKKSLRPAS